MSPPNLRGDTIRDGMKRLWRPRPPPLANDVGKNRRARLRRTHKPRAASWCHPFVRLRSDEVLPPPRAVSEASLRPADAARHPASRASVSRRLSLASRPRAAPSTFPRTPGAPPKQRHRTNRRSCPPTLLARPGRMDRVPDRILDGLRQLCLSARARPSTIRSANPRIRSLDGVPPPGLSATLRRVPRRQPG